MQMETKEEGEIIKMQTETQSGAGEDDPLTIDDDLSGPWCRRCPTFCTMGSMTFFFALLGILIGGVAYEANIQESWLNCYKSPGSDSYDKSCWLELIQFPGQLWIKGLKCLIVPLMMSMMITLPERISNIGKVGVRLLCLLVFTSFVAAMEGLVWAWIFRPGEGVETPRESTLAKNKVSEFESVLNIFDLFVPSNIVDAMQGGDILAIIAVFLVYGLEINKCPDQWKRPVLNINKAILRATLSLLVKLMWFTPIAMCSLIAYNLAMTDDLWNIFEALGKYVGCQLLGQFVHLTGFYFTFYFLATGKNPLKYFWAIKDAPITALITSSSAATMPVTLRVNKEVMNDNALVQFCIPIGAGMNMDGTSLGFPVMVMFTAQMAQDFELSSAAQFTIAIMAMVCSLGTAPVPNAGLVFLTMLYTTADIPEASQSMGYALIAAVDWLVDRVETAQNVSSDSFICGILSHYYKTDNSGCLHFFMKGFNEI